MGTITRIGKAFEPNPNAIGMAENGIIVTRVNQPLIDEVLTFRRTHDKVKMPDGSIQWRSNTRPQRGPVSAEDSYYHC